MSSILGYYQQEVMTKLYEKYENFHLGPLLYILGQTRTFLENLLLPRFCF